CTTNSWNADYW
nr:immunoglobulin heavy chain junction region [Macaca mulatta]